MCCLTCGRMWSLVFWRQAEAHRDIPFLLCHVPGPALPPTNELCGSEQVFLPPQVAFLSPKIKVLKVHSMFLYMGWTGLLIGLLLEGYPGWGVLPHHEEDNNLHLALLTVLSLGCKHHQNSSATLLLFLHHTQIPKLARGGEQNSSFQTHWPYFFRASPFTGTNKLDLPLCDPAPDLLVLVGRCAPWKGCLPSPAYSAWSPSCLMYLLPTGDPAHGIASQSVLACLGVARWPGKLSNQLAWPIQAHPHNSLPPHLLFQCRSACPLLCV